jgi:hypothetical protein
MPAFLVADSRIIRCVMGQNIVKGYYEEAYPPLPTRTTKFFRKNLIFQFFRFIVLNLKIMRIIVGGHS